MLRTNSAHSPASLLNPVCFSVSHSHNACWVRLLDSLIQEGLLIFSTVSLLCCVTEVELSLVVDKSDSTHWSLT